MGQLRKKIVARLRRSFPPPDKVRVREEDGIVGVVVSAAFRGKDDLDRVDMVWEAIDHDLSPGERREITMIAAVTPEEDAALASMD